MYIYSSYVYILITCVCIIIVYVHVYEIHKHWAINYGKDWKFPRATFNYTWPTYSLHMYIHVYVFILYVYFHHIWVKSFYIYYSWCIYACRKCTRTGPRTMESWKFTTATFSGSSPYMSVGSIPRRRCVRDCTVLQQCVAVCCSVLQCVAVAVPHTWARAQFQGAGVYVTLVCCSSVLQ